MHWRCLVSSIVPIVLILASLACTSCGSDGTASGTGPSTANRPADALAAGPFQQKNAVDEKAVRLQLKDTTNGEKRYALLDSLAADYLKAGGISDSIRIREEIIEDGRVPTGWRSLEASSLAAMYAPSGYSQSRRLLDRALALARATTPAELETLPKEPLYAAYPVEEELDQRWLGQWDLALKTRREDADLAWHNLNDPLLSERRHRAATNELISSSSSLIRELVQNNHRAEALSYANEISWDVDNRPDMKPSVEQRAELNVARAIALCSYDDYDGALAAIDAAIDGFRKADIPPYSTNYANAVRLRLLITLALRRIGDYRADADQLESDAKINPDIVRGGIAAIEEQDSLVLAARGNWRDAQTQIAAAMALDRRSHGPESTFYRYMAAMQMLYRLEDPSAQVRYAQIADYVSPLVGADDQWNDMTRGAYDEDAALALSMDRAMREGEQGQILAFRIAELFHVNATQGAMTDGAVRLVAPTPALRVLVEQEQALRFERSTALSAARRTSLDNQIASVRAQIASEFSLYRQLASPAMPTPAGLGGVLHEGEVYLDIYAGLDSSYAFVVHPGGAFRAIRLETTRAEITKQIIALRSSFDAGLPPRRAGELAGFDMAAASDLYQTLIAPLQDDIKEAKTVYIGTSGILASIPFNVLLTHPATSLLDASWWINTTTPVRMPSASALVFARSHPATHAGEPFIAFAAPSFGGRESAPTASLPSDGAPARAIPLDSRSASFDYRNVTALPETLEEANSIAKALDAPVQSVRWGPAASRSEVMKMDLSNDRVVLFATHGIVAGEIPGWRKAGLAMAYEGNGLADSILTADDIVTLRLNADWVVLSACNTGVATGNAGDAISELSRAFFAAGARSMLVTQWAVESKSATEVTTGLFRAYAADASLSKADALARTERDMANGKDGELYRHPYFWGAYVLTGDAAR